jgi:Spy/CpxP family protein refolding chaperone
VGKRVLIAALLVSAAINLVAVFTLGFYWREETRHRQHFPPLPGFGNRGQNLDRLKERLKLTDAQMDTIRKIDEDVKTRMKSLSQSVFEKRRELMTLMSESNADHNRTDSLFRAIVALQDELEEQAYGSLVRIRGVLTTEQRKEMIELLPALMMEGAGPPGSPPGIHLSPGGPPPGMPPMGVPGH